MEEVFGSLRGDVWQITAVVSVSAVLGWGCDRTDWAEFTHERPELFCILSGQIIICLIVAERTLLSRVVYTHIYPKLDSLIWFSTVLMLPHNLLMCRSLYMWWQATNNSVHRWWRYLFILVLTICNALGLFIGGAACFVFWTEHFAMKAQNSEFLQIVQSWKASFKADKYSEACHLDLMRVIRFT